MGVDYILLRIPLVSPWLIHFEIVRVRDQWIPRTFFMPMFYCGLGDVHKYQGRQVTSHTSNDM